MLGQISTLCVGNNSDFAKRIQIAKEHGVDVYYSLLISIDTNSKATFQKTFLRRSPD